MNDTKTFKSEKSWTSSFWLVAFVIGLVLIILSLFGIIFCAASFAESNLAGTQYAVVIDAGSSGSRPTLFKWTNSAFRDDGRVEQVNSTPVSPGISSYLNDPGQVFTTVEPAIKTLVDGVVPKNQLKETQLYMIATAGIRLTNLANPDQTTLLFERIRHDFLNSVLLLTRPDEHIRVSSGAEEGLNGWYSINYLKGKIGEDDNSPSDGLLGSLDLGGASTQIAFLVAQPSSDPRANLDIFPRTIRGKDYNIYSHSFLCYGRDEFERFFWAKLLENNVLATPTINNPCYLTGYSRVVLSADIYQSQCVIGPLATRMFGQRFAAPAGFVSVTFTGTGNPTQCTQTIASIFQNLPCEASPCSINGVHQPPPNGHYMAYSAFSFFISQLGVSNSTTNLTRSQVRNVVQQYCARQWNTVTPQNVYMATNCFTGLYVDLLLQAYGFISDDSWRNIDFSTKVNGQSIGWALGYMVDAAGRLPAKSPPVNLPLVTLVTMIVVYIILLILGIVLVIMSLRKCMHNSYNDEI